MKKATILRIVLDVFIATTIAATAYSRLYWSTDVALWVFAVSFFSTSVYSVWMVKQIKADK